MESNEDRAVIRRALETSMHLGVVAVLVIYCFQVVRPFIQRFACGVIIAVANLSDLDGEVAVQTGCAF